MSKNKSQKSLSNYKKPKTDSSKPKTDSSKPKTYNPSKTIGLSVIILMISIIYFYFKNVDNAIDNAAGKRIVGLGDLHGDLENTIKILEFSKIINHKQEWISGTDILVQTGDVVDRGKDARKIYKLLLDLKKQATAQGGDVIQLLGNHEIMNLMDLWDYVTQEDILEFGGFEERKKAFDKENGYLGKYLKTLNISVVVGSTLFVHGGIHPEWAKAFGLEKLNLITNQLLLKKQVNDLKEKYFLFGPDSPTWYRGYVKLPEDEACSLLKEALKILKVERMVVGHTPQLSGKILNRCDGRFIDIDVGISSVYGGYLAALEIYPDRINALYPSGPVSIKRTFK